MKIKISCFRTKRSVKMESQQRNLQNPFNKVEELKMAAPGPVGIYLLKVNNRDTRTQCEIC